MTGATGFVGQTLLDEIEKAIRPGIDLEMCTALSRNPRVAQELLDPLQTREWLNYANYSVKTEIQDIGEYDAIFHLAVPASAVLNTYQPDEMYSLNVEGVDNIIEFASRQITPPTILLSSSGAVYGDMPEGLERIPEGWQRPKSLPAISSAYAEGKITAEERLRQATREGKCLGLIARLFAFSGIHLPLDRHFAIGNFVRDAISEQRITIRSNGSPIRSYMDGQDMAQWLLRILEAGSSDEIYHVGSERAISIKDLATLVSRRYELLTSNAVSVDILDQSSPIDGVSRYVPSTERTRTLLNLEENVDLEWSIDQMIINGMKIHGKTTSD